MAGSVSPRTRSGFLEPFSSGFGFLNLQGMDGFGELTGAPRAAPEFSQDAPGFQLGVGALARGSQLRVSAAGVFRRGGLVSSPVGAKDVVTGAAVGLMRLDRWLDDASLIYL